MMGTQASNRQPALFSYHIDLEARVAADHLLRQVAAVLDLSFVAPAVRHLYGRSGNVSLDPKIILKMMLLLFLYNVPSERELMEQVGVRLDFLWFLGFDLDTEIPNHSVLSKARARWGEEVFQKLFIQMLQQCVKAGLVNGSLLHIDSTIVKASASKDSVVTTSPEMVSALRQAYQQQRCKLGSLGRGAARQHASRSATRTRL
jgi:transposase